VSEPIEADHPDLGHRERLRGSGNAARWFVIPWSTVVIGLAISYLIGDATHARLLTDHEALFAAGFIVVLVPLVARSLFLGIWRAGHSLIIRSWFRTVTLSRAAGSCKSVGYRGLLMYGESDMFRMLEFSDAQHPRFVLRGTIALRKSSMEQAGTLNKWLNSGSSPTFATHNPRNVDSPRASQHRADAR
jgi:hypothetical protein